MTQETKHTRVTCAGSMAGFIDGLRDTGAFNSNPLIKAQADRILSEYAEACKTPDPAPDLLAEAQEYRHLLEVNGWTNGDRYTRLTAAIARAEGQS